MFIHFNPTDEDFYTDIENKEKRIIIAKFFQNQIEQGINLWEKDKEYLTTNGHTIRFDKEIIARPRKHNKQEGMRFEIISNKILGRGGQGDVYEGIGVIAIMDNGDLNYKQYGKPYQHKIKDFRVVKKGFHQSLAVERLNNEVQEMGYKPAVRTPNSSYAVFMKKMGDYDLSMISLNLTHYRKGAETRNKGIRLSLDLSLNEKLNLTRSLIENLSTLILNKKIVHRDIKPDNIRFNYINNQFKTYFIDTDNQCPIGEKQKTIISSGKFTPTEVFDKNHLPDPSQDIYSMGKVLSELWENELKTLSDKKNNQKNTKTELLQIQELINCMIKPTPLERATINNINDQIEKIKLTETCGKTKLQEMKFLNAVKLNDQNLVDEMLNNSAINLYTIKDSMNLNPLSLAIQRHNMPLINLFLKKGLRPDKINEKQYGSILFEVLFDPQRANFEKKPIEERIMLAKHLIKNNICSLFPKFWEIQNSYYPYNCFISDKNNRTVLKQCLADPIISPLIINNQAMQSMFIAIEKKIIQNIQSILNAILFDRKNIEKEKSVFERFKTTESEKFLNIIIAQFTNYDSKNENDPVKIHQKFIALTKQIINYHSKTDNDVIESLKNDLLHEDSLAIKFLTNHLTEIPYKSPTLKQNHEEIAVDLNNILPPPDLNL